MQYNLKDTAVRVVTQTNDQLLKAKEKPREGYLYRGYRCIRR